MGSNQIIGPIRIKDHPLSKCWRDIKWRCHGNPKNPTKNVRNYKGRGITVCERWRKSFWNFVADIGEKPSVQHSIERIDNNRGYEPGNVRWATASEQNSN